MKAADTSAAVVNTTMIRAAYAAESPNAQGSPRSACSKAALLQLLVWKRLLRTSLRSLLCSYRGTGARSETMTTCMSLAWLMILCTGSLDSSGTHMRPLGRVTKI